MNREQTERAGEIFLEVCDLEEAARLRRLDELCGSSGELREAVCNLLRRDAGEHGLLAEEALGAGRQFGTPEPEPTPGVAEAGAPDRVGRYRILRKIGEGGMGAVFEAEQDHPRRRVALKRIRPGAVSPGLLKRFQHEAELLGRLQHRGIAQIHEAGTIETETGPQPFFAMEFIDGIELREYAKRHGLSPAARLELIARVADAVHHAHLKGIIHRDLKPDNVLVVDETAHSDTGLDASFATLGQPKILDFGVARATDSDVQLTTMHTSVGQLIGTIPYMSPEQVAGDPRELDIRSDIHALGVILYELLSGRLPYDLMHRTIPEAARIIREEEPTRLGSIDTAFRGDIDTIVGKALEKDRERRYSSAAELAADIRRHLTNQPISAHPPSTFYQFWKFARRNQGLMIGLAAAALFLVAGLIASLSLASRAMDGERRAQQGETAARRSAYRFAIAAAQATGDTDPRRALEQLEIATVESRGWEWRHLRSRFQPQVAHVEVTGDLPRSVWVAAGQGRTPICAIVRDGNIELMELETGEVRATYRDEAELGWPLLSADGSRLAAVAAGHIIVWDVPSETRLLEHPLDACRPERSRLSGDGSHLAITSRKGGLTVIETATGAIRFSVAPTSVWDRHVWIDRDGSHVLAGRAYGYGRFNIDLYSVDGELLASKVHTEGFATAAVSPDGKWIAVGCDQRQVRILSSSDLEIRQTLYGHSRKVCAAAFSADGRYVATSSDDGTNRVWDLQSGRCVRVVASEPAESITFDATGANLAASSRTGARMWAWSHGARLVLDDHESYVYSAEFSPDGSMVATCAWDNTIRLWDGQTGEPLAVIPNPEAWRALSFNPDGSRLISFSTTCRYSIYDTATALPIDVPRSAADEAFLATRHDQDRYGPLLYARACAAGARTYISGDSPEQATDYDRRLVARAVKSGEILISDLTSGAELRRIGTPGRPVEALAFHPDGTRLAAGHLEGWIDVWDLQNGDKLATLIGHESNVYALDYSPDGTRLASGGNDNSIVLWDADTFEQVAVLRGHNSYVHSIRFSPDGTQLVSGSGDSTVCIWDSLSPLERRRQNRERRLLRERMAPHVCRLLLEGKDPPVVADRIREDSSLTEDERRAALRVLLLKSVSKNEEQDPIDK